MSARPHAVVDPDEAGPLLAEVRRGLAVAGVPKTLRPWVFYDDEGSRLFEEITALPEYYLTRTERALLEEHADELVQAARGEAPRLHLVELGAGTATKTQLLLAAAVRMQGTTQFIPTDVSAFALDVARERLARELPEVQVSPFVGRHEEALPRVRAVGPRRLVCFLGSSLGNFDDADNVALFSAVASSLAPGGALLLGADRRKDPALLLPAYDDAAGVTGRFNKNALVRLNRELGADFDVDAFRHEARWNDVASRIEMHLVATRPMVVTVPGLDGPIAFAAGESIHTENSTKYADARLDGILDASGFVRERSVFDDEGRFGLHLCRRR
jgi:L-histidine Nalpha-methyltransferase